MSDPNREGEEFRKARRGRNIAIAVGLAVFVILVYVVTIVNLGSDVIHRPF
jgi:t-SNARE complex subunit (syntaxin)